MLIIKLMLASAILANLPIVEEKIDWGISEKQLKQHVKVEQTSNGSGHGHGYSDFLEVNPVVYVENSIPNKKTEFYFFQNKLYKVYTIYRNQSDPEAFYKQKADKLESLLGKPQASYTDELFSMPIQHTIWESDEEQLDLRFGAGYVYEVRINKPLSNDKQMQIDIEQAI